MSVIQNSCKHEQLTALLRAELKKNRFPGNRFYTVKQLMEHYQVSQATLTRAMIPLFDEGVLYSVPGKGTFVREKQQKYPQSDLQMIFCVVSSQEVFHRDYNPGTWFALQDIFSGIAKSTGEHGGSVNLITINSDGPEFRHLATMPNSAFIFLEYDRFEAQIEYCIKKNLPYAIYAKHHKLTRNIKQVWLDTEQAQYDAVSHLIARGHRQIGFIGDKRNSSRHKGFCAAMRDAGLSCSLPKMAFLPDGDEESAYQAAMKLIAVNPELTAIACSTDLRALGVMQAVEDSGRRIPAFAVTGIDDVGRTYYDLPENMTTVHLPFKEIGEALVNMAYSEDKSLCIRMAPALVVRQTS
ncbi:MAG: substrate-binding domain-containing protein [Lentisphaeria bacterium]|nr:substrate-binding domain-containing protein [Lentisphaeria bacterium]